MSHAPRWPVGTVPVVLVAEVVASFAASIALALVGSAFGAGDLTPGLVLAIALVDLALAWFVLRSVAGRVDIDLQPAGVGLRRVPARMGLVALGFGLAVALVSAAVTAGVTDVDLPHPPEFGEETAVVLDAGSAATILARGVLAAIAVELVLRGFLVPAVMSQFARSTAVVVAALLTATIVPLEIVPAAVAVGIALGVMYTESGSILPGIGLAGAFHGFVLGLRFEWSVPECAALAVVTGALAFLLVAVPTRSWDRDPRPS